MLSSATLMPRFLVPDIYSSSRVTGSVACKLPQNLRHQPTHATDSAIAHFFLTALQVGQEPPSPSPPPRYFIPLVVLFVSRSSKPREKQFLLREVL